MNVGEKTLTLKVKRWLSQRNDEAPKSFISFRMFIYEIYVYWLMKLTRNWGWPIANGKIA